MIGILRNLLFLILCTSPFLLSSFSISAQNCTDNATNDAGDVITFNGVTYNETSNGCTSTWSYCLTAGPGNPEISHFMIANNSCLACFDSESDILDSSHPVEVGTDPTTGQCGIKFDFGLLVNEEICFSFTLDGAFEVAERLFVTKAGQNVHTIAICGPECRETICEDNNPPPPPEEEDDPPSPELDCPSVAINDAGDEITFVGVTYNSENGECTSSTWSYCLKAGPGNPEISHFNIASPNCLACLDSENDILYASHPFEIGTDPTTGQCGIKFDFGLNVNEEICFSFTLDGTFAVSEQLFVTKAGQNVHTVAICGPECTEVSCEGGEEPEELDCTDVVANRPVENTNDNCGNWCDAYVFTLGAGNCYVAGGDLYFTEYNNGTATLIGSVVQGNSVGYLNVLFSGRTDVAPSGSPKYMLCVDDGAEFWYYYPEFTGTFTYPNGNTTTIIRRGPSFQVGYGANVQDYEYGASGWFDTSDGDIGDMNFQLGSPEICEETEIFLEVECAEVGSLFQTYQDSEASNGDYVTVAPNNNAYDNAPTSPESRIRFTVELTAAGSYFIFARVKTPSTYDDSFWVRVNDGTWVKWNEIPQSNNFAWAQVHDNTNNNTPVSFYLEAGSNTIDFAYREDGTQLDKIYIGQSENSPTGIGAEATNCICEEELVLTCTPTNETCDGSNTPGIDLEVNGATSTLSYLWSNGATTQDLDNIEAGTYSVTVTSLNGCTAICSTTVEDDIPLTIECFATNATCTNSGGTTPSGMVTVMTNGGVAPFSYQWSNGSTAPAIDGVAPGTYSVTVTSADGCAQTCSATVETEATFNLNCQVINDYCNGNTNAAIYLELTVDPATVSYLWSNGSTDGILAGVGPGTYSVTVTSNASGCSKTCSATIEPLEPFSIECIATNTTCGNTDDGTVTVIVTGGTGPYVIHWENGTCTDYDSGLEAGEYPIMVTDANGCEANCVAVVEPSESLAVSCSPTIGDCNSAFGDITTQVVGGSGVYTYEWSNGSTSPNLYNITPGTYSVTVTDENGCFGICEATYNQLSPIQLTCLPSNTNCGAADGTITANVTGGTAPYSYEWSNGATTPNQINLGAGTYSLTVTDGNGCFSICETVIEENSAPEITCTASEASCGANNGSIFTQVSFGSAPYSYLWSNGSTSANQNNLPSGTYAVTVTDANGCQATCSGIIESTPGFSVSCNAQSNTCESNSNSISVNVNGGTGAYTFLWSNGSTESALENVEAGTYSVTVTDELGCFASCEATIEVYESLIATCEANNLDCTSEESGTVSVLVSGGLAPYTYAWNNGSSSEIQNNLPVGTYEVTVTDANGCSTTCSASVTEAEPIIVISSSTPLECFGDSTSVADFIISGGTAPYTYIWDNGSTDPVITGLSAGFYGITVTDANGCIGICGTWVEGPEAIEATFENTDVTCFGGNDGTANVTITGGTGAYSFLWSNGATTQNISGLVAEDYFLTVSDENGCTQTFTTTVESNTPVEVICTATPLSCPNAEDGNILVAVNGGTGNYTFDWSNGASTQNLLNIAEGTYTLTVTDENGCTSTCTSLVESPTPLNLVCTVSDLICAGPQTGAITTQVSGGNTPYTYQWDNGATSQNLENLNTGSYTLTVTDANGCTIICTSNVETSPPLTVSIEGQDLLCGEANTGVAAAIVEGGTAPYTYTWSNGATSAQINNLNEGTYELTVTDDKGCTANATITITAIPVLNLVCSTDDLICGDANSGIIETSIDGGTAPFDYQWSNGATTEHLIGVNEGTYSLTVTDANGCTVTCTSTLIYIEPIVATCSTSDLICATPGTGSINLDVVGGTAPYTYLWSNGANVQNLENLDGGEYSVTVFDANGCAAISSCEVLSDLPLELTCEVIGATCGDDQSGDIDATISGGLAPYTFLWNNDETTEDLTDILSGTYTLTVTDANGCTITCTSVVETSLGLNLTVSTEGTQCGEEGTGSAELTVTGGTGIYTINWSNGATSENLENLDAGSYGVTVTDNNGCSSVAVAVVDESSAMEAVCEPNNIPCGGEQTGSVDLTVIGGEGPYGFEWSNGSVAEDLSSVGAGTYFVTITDSNGCQTICSSTVTESPAFTLSCSSNSVSCKNGNDGAVEVSINGGEEPFTYEWSNGAISQNLNNLSAGTYIITATDANGCTASCTAIVSEPATLIVVAQGNDISCNGQTDGSAFATVIGGTVPYTYAWSNGATTSFINALSAGTYTLTVTDGNGCSNFGAITINEPTVLDVTCNANPQDCQTLVGSIITTVNGGKAPFTYTWSDGSSDPTLSNALPGNYSVTVTDASGCTTVCSADIAPANPINLTCVATNESCGTPSLGSVDLTVTGGTGPYFYQWSNGIPTEDLMDVPAGTYSVTVTDIFGCSSVCTSIVEPAPSLGIELNSQNVLCNGAATGSIQATVTLGMPPFSYTWSNGSNADFIENLTAGTYSLTVVDANGCSSVASATISQPSNILVVVSANPVRCNGGNDGTAFATAIGGIAPYQYSWSNGMPTSFINNLTAGTYTVTVTDANGCTSVGTTVVQEPQAIEISFETTLLTCGSDTDGSIIANISGGLAPLNYQWSTGATTESIDGLGAGTYGLIITDANGCTSSAFVDITAANPIVLDCTASNVICAGEENGSVEVNVSGGALPYSFNWSNGATSQSVIDLAAGTYTVTVTDANGCTATCSSIVNEPQPLVAEYGSTDVTCNGGNDGTLFAHPTGGTAPYNYEWSTGDNTETVENLPAGAYGLTLTDANGCIFICGIIISEPEAITCTTEVNPAISGTSNLFDVTVMASGGTGALEYSIDGGITYQSNNIFADLPAGTYPIVTQDENECTSTCEAIVDGDSGLTEGTQSSMTLSPNPATTGIEVSYEAITEGLHSFELKTLAGQVLYSEEIFMTLGQNIIPVDVSNLANGTYALIVYSSSGVTTEQFTVAR